MPTQPQLWLVAAVETTAGDPHDKRTMTSAMMMLIN